MWNFHSRMFLQDARANLSTELETGAVGKYTKEELDEFEKTLKEHESWLDEWVEKQKRVKMNEDPVILTSEMRARAKALENHLQRLVRKRPPPKTRKAKPTSSATTESATSATASGAASETESPESGSASGSQDSPRHEEL